MESIQIIILIFLFGIVLELSVLYFASTITLNDSYRLWLNLSVIIGFVCSLAISLHAAITQSSIEISQPVDTGPLLILFLINISLTYELFYLMKHLQKQVQLLSQKANFDFLTNALSREEILSRCQYELKRSYRTAEPLSLLTLDIDSFKIINDQHGHPFGDQVLMKVVASCKELLRDIDCIGRIGGDEFIILLPGASQTVAKEISNRIHMQIKRVSAELDNVSNNPVTVSIGISCIYPNTPARSMQEIEVQSILTNLVINSDKALYQAKYAGRNKTVCNIFYIPFFN